MKKQSLFHAYYIVSHVNLPVLLAAAVADGVGATGAPGAPGAPPGGPPAPPVFLLKRLLKKFASTPSLLCAPGLLPSSYIIGRRKRRKKAINKSVNKNATSTKNTD